MQFKITVQKGSSVEAVERLEQKFANRTALMKRIGNFVKCLPVRKFAEYASLIDIEVELIALATDLTPEQIDTLTPDDSGKIFDKIHELNFEPFMGWLKRKVSATKLRAQAFRVDLPKNESMTSGETSAD